MPGFIESNITLNFPDNNFFRFADCEGYRVLSGYNFKEMDACWYDNTHNLYWLIELKDFTNAALDNHQNVESRAWNLLIKAVDSLCMFLSCKHTYTYSINQCLPFVPDLQTEFKFISIVHCNPAQAGDVQLINNSFRSKFKPYALLFGITHYAVMEHSLATRNLPYGMIQ